MKLRTRLHLVVTGLTIVWVIVLVTSEVQVTRARAQEEIEAANQVATQLLGRLVNIYWRAGGTRIVTDFLTQLGHVRSNDIMLTYPGGPVVYHSPPATYKAGRYAPAWFAHLLVRRIPRYTFRLPSGLELIVQAEPSRGILDGWDAIARLLLIAAVMLLFVNGLAFWIVERAVAPVLIEQRLEEERRLIAHELHDEFGQSVTAIRSLAQAIVGQSSQPPMQEAARLISEEAARLYDAMHGLIPRLAPAALDTIGFSQALEGLVRDLQRRHPAVILTLRQELAVNPGPDVSLAAYRVVQEGLINALRHASASQVDVELRAERHRITVTVTDDGIGLPQDWSRPGHYGLQGLGERVAHLGGKLTLRNCGARGTLLAAEMPLAGLPRVSG
ncbi:MAG TPA: ATP-binding protein [Steroidobacteraceae bacterium]|jgi:signal transduction histidine kinase|nr:ATP-binding protein [Steroidobacteraceae bacterium]